jgi:uncharacterized protein (TIGR02996 family)
MNLEDERAALLRGILEQPDDDTVRLVYADWLEEKGGEPEFAAYIRLHVQEQQRTFTRLGPSDSLMFRGKHIAAGIRSLRGAGVYPDGKLILSRGFVSGLEMTLDQFRKNAKALFELHPITEVVICNHEPQSYHNNGGPRIYGWWRRTVNHDVYPPDMRTCDLPGEIWEHVMKFPGCTLRGWWADFRSRQGAWQAASYGCVTYGRTLANLPLLPLPEPTKKAARSRKAPT